MDIELKSAVDAIEQKLTAFRSEVDGVKGKDVLTETKFAKMEADLASALSAKSAIENRLAAVETAAARPNVAGKAAEVGMEHKEAFLNFVRAGGDHASKSAVAQFEQKLFNTQTPSAGGAAVPSVIAAEIAGVALDYSPLRSISRVITVGTPNYTELLSNRNAGAATAGELAERLETDTSTLTEVKPTFGEIYGYAFATSHSINDAFFDVQSWLVSEVGESIGQKESALFMNGTGNNEATGLLTGNRFGTVKTGKAAALGDNPFDNIMDLRYSLKAGYAQRGSFLMNSATLAALAKVKNANGDYLYQAAVSQGVADTLIGKPVHIDEGCDNIAAGKRPVLFGDFARGFLIVDIANQYLTVDTITRPGFVKVYVAKRVGSVVKDANAIKALTVAA